MVFRDPVFVIVDVKPDPRDATKANPEYMYQGPVIRPNQQ